MLFRSHPELSEVPAGVSESCAASGIQLQVRDPSGPLVELVRTAQVGPVIYASSERFRSMLLRDLVLYEGERQVARLSPIHRGNYRAWQLLHPRFSGWAGALPKGSTAATARMEYFPGIYRYCRVVLE